MKYSIFDAHCDTVLKLKALNTPLFDNDFEVSIKKMLGYKSFSQVFAVFNEGNLYKKDILEHISLLKNEFLMNDKYIKFAINSDEIKTNETQKKFSALISIEGIGNTPDVCEKDILDFYNEGVRIISLTWNNDNSLCGGILNNNLGLTKKGKKILKQMESLGIILDVSHISDLGFNHVFDYYGGKICATHSNSRTICPHSRNLLDSQFKEIVNRKGVVGINLFPEFITENNSCKIDDVIKHIEHFLMLGGENSIGLGADFDGIEYTVFDIPDCSFLYRLFDQMLKKGIKEETIHKISHLNFTKLLHFN